MDAASGVCNSLLPRHWAIRRWIAQYVVALFHYHRFRFNPDRGKTDGQLSRPTPLPISFRLMEDCDSVARTLALAFRNQCKSKSSPASRTTSRESGLTRSQQQRAAKSLTSRLRTA